MNKTWKEIPGFSNYKCSQDGDVLSKERVIETTRGPRKIKERILKMSKGKNSNYYKYILVNDNGEAKSMTVHRLVAMTYIPNPMNYKVVHHKDHNTLNNNVENLEWCSYSDNIKYSIESGRFSQTFSKDRNPIRFLSDDHVKAAMDLYSIGWTQQKISEIFNVSRPYISEILSGKKRATS